MECQAFSGLPIVWMRRLSKTHFKDSSKLRINISILKRSPSYVSVVYPGDETQQRSDVKVINYVHLTRELKSLEEGWDADKPR